MTPLDAYLAQVDRHLAGMDRRVRQDILRELHGHLVESAAANGGNVGIAIAQMGPAAEVGRGYKRVYGYGAAFHALFLALAAGLAVLSVPVLQETEAGLAPLGLSVPVLGGLVAWLLWVGVRAGSKVGLYAGLTACGSRLATFAAVAAVEPGAFAAIGGLSLFVGTSAVLVVLGWLPGTAKKVWTGPKAEL